MFQMRDEDPDEDNQQTSRSKYFIAGSVLKKSDPVTTISTTTPAATPITSITSNSSSMSSSQQSIQSNASSTVTNSGQSVTNTSPQKGVPLKRSGPAVNNSYTVLVNPNQKANKLLRYLRSPYVLSDSVSPAHYLMYESCCGIFLSLKYHVIYPNYIYDTLTALRNSYQLQVLLVLVDHIEYQSSLKELTQMAIRTGCTLMLAWSYEEAANYIDNYRHFGDKSPDIIMGRTNGSTATDDYGRVVDALTTVRSINKTDAVSLISTFDTIENIVQSDDDQLIICPGMAALKAQRLREFFHKTFIRSD